MKKAVLPIAALTAAISTMSVKADVFSWPNDPVFIGSISASATKLNVEAGEVSGPASIAGTFYYQGEQSDSFSDKQPQPPGTTSVSSKVSLLSYKVTNKEILDQMVTLGDIPSSKGWAISWIGSAEDPADGGFYATAKGLDPVAVPSELLALELLTDGVQGGSASETTAYNGDLLQKYSFSGKGYVPVAVTVGSVPFVTEETANGVASVTVSSKLDKSGLIFTTVSLKGPIDGDAAVSETES
jgi:hypothetical protein